MPPQRGSNFPYSSRLSYLIGISSAIFMTDKRLRFRRSRSGPQFKGECFSSIASDLSPRPRLMPVDHAPTVRKILPYRCDDEVLLDRFAILA